VNDESVYSGYSYHDSEEGPVCAESIRRCDLNCHFLKTGMATFVPGLLTNCLFVDERFHDVVIIFCL